MSTSRARRRQSGAATAEFALAAVPLLLAGTVAVEAGHWLMARQLVRLALHEAARAGAVQHGHPDAIRDAFEAALSPLYVPAGAHGSPLARMHASHARIRRDTGMAPWRMAVLGPPAAAYRDFGRPGGAHGGRPAISNDYLAEQHARAQARWPQGTGPQSGLDIHQANMLHLRLTYLRRPLAPMMGGVLKAMSFAAPASARPALAAGLLPLTLDSRMTMQSDPVAWDLPGGAIAGREAGQWPLEPAPAPLPPSSGGSAPPSSQGPGLPPVHETLPGADGGPAPRPVVPEDDTRLCGVVLCC